MSSNYMRVTENSFTYNITSQSNNINLSNDNYESSSDSILDKINRDYKKNRIVKK